MHLKNTAWSLLITVALFAPAALPAVAGPTEDPTAALEPASLWLGDLGPVEVSDLPTVFAAVVAALPPEVLVLPSENYLYYRFASQGTTYWGNLRLDPVDREHGQVHFAYYPEFSADDGHRPQPQYRLLGPADGLALEKVGPLTYVLRVGADAVRIALDDLPQHAPPAEVLAPGERFVFRTTDESRYPFLLAFDTRTDSFRWLLDEARPLPERLLPEGEDILVGERSGFAFAVDRAHGDRKVLAAVRADDSRANTYYDGPFDQLADNAIVDDAFQQLLERAYPHAAGRIDWYGHYLDQVGKRMAIITYGQYDGPGALAALAGASTAPGAAEYPDHNVGVTWPCPSDATHTYLTSNPPPSAIAPVLVQGCALAPPLGGDGPSPGASGLQACTDTAPAEPVHMPGFSTTHVPGTSELGGLDHSLFFSSFGVPGIVASGGRLGVVHDGETTRTCTDPLHYFGYSEGGPMPPTACSRPLPETVKHISESSEVHFSSVSAGVVPGIIHTPGVHDGATTEVVSGHDWPASTAPAVSVWHDPATTEGCTGHYFGWSSNDHGTTTSVVAGDPIFHGYIASMMEVYPPTHDGLVSISVECRTPRGKFNHTDALSGPCGSPARLFSALGPITQYPLLGSIEDQVGDPGWSREPNHPGDRYPGALGYTGPDPLSRHHGWYNDYGGYTSAGRAWLDAHLLREAFDAAAVTAGGSCVLCVSGAGLSTGASPEPEGSPEPGKRSLGPGRYYLDGLMGQWQDKPQVWEEATLLGDGAGVRTVSNGPDGWIGNIANTTGAYTNAYGPETCPTEQGDGPHLHAECHPYLDGLIQDPQVPGGGEWTPACVDGAEGGWFAVNPEGGVFNFPALVWRGRALDGTNVTTLEDWTGASGPLYLGYQCIEDGGGAFRSTDALVLPLGNLGQAVVTWMHASPLGWPDVVDDVDEYAPVG